MYQQMHYLLLEESIKVFTLNFTLILLQHVLVLDHHQAAYSCYVLVNVMRIVAACCDILHNLNLAFVGT
jgi:hypothetical protein